MQAQAGCGRYPHECRILPLDTGRLRNKGGTTEAKPFVLCRDEGFFFLPMLKEVFIHDRQQRNETDGDADDVSAA
jgi:hypothetical protein